MAKKTARYEVISDHLAGHARGDVVTAAQLAGCDIDTLIAGHHLAPRPAQRKPAEETD